MNKAIILLSGGIDSAVVLAKALEEGKTCIALSFDYGQRHRIELLHAKKIATHYGIEHKILKIDPGAFSKTSLMWGMDVPMDRSPEEIATSGIPSTYVPARNTLFISFAIGQAEIYEAGEIHIGPNALDHSPYPDCRPEFYAAFQEVIRYSTKQAVEGNPPQLKTPLIKLDKTEIVREARRLKVPLEMTFSCYSPTHSGEACLRCDTCTLRNIALSKANL